MSRVMVLACLAVLAAVGCSRKAPLPVAPVTSGAEMRSLVGYDLWRLAGNWQQVGVIRADGGACERGRLAIAKSPSGLSFDGALCRDGGLRQVSGPVQVVGPGRILVAGEAEPWWLVWADYDARTMILAPPSKRFAVVLDRGRISPDRMKAAREMLAFNGFDASRLR